MSRRYPYPKPVVVASCYHIHYIDQQPVPQYLPLVNLQAHATIRSTAFSTTLTQEFTNPSKESLEEVKYTFPLYDGVSVGSFQCSIGDRVIHGLVKERDQARKVYTEAKARGETAGLLEQLPQASDVFTTSIGNIPPKEKVIVNITYVGELKNDAEIDGIRYTIPTRIAPRYGTLPGDILGATTSGSGEMQITVDVEMDDNCAIKKIQSPSHPISMSIGTLSTNQSAEPSLSRGSATLALGTTELDRDFVLQIVAKDTGIPRAFLEIHPKIPNSTALMATLVPKFSLKPIRPEIIFVADRSGSMTGCIPTLIAAMEVFLKSMPLRVKFNICSFGSRHEFLFNQSQSYNQQSLQTALDHVKNFSANFGGTETYSAIEAAIKSRFTDIPTEIMLLTDGDIWSQNSLFELLNQEVAKSKGSLRLFSLGIGMGVSHSLIEGVARAGNGFAQTVNNGERMEGKLVRMLKGALTPHIHDYSLEVKYADEDVDSDFEIIERVSDSLKINLTLEEKPVQDVKKTISLYDPDTDVDMADAKHAEEDRFAHLPAVSVPKFLQTPHWIPPLFPFHRTTVYLIMSGQASSIKPASVLLKATSEQGPLELEIPVQRLAQPGEMIHKLAAKKAIQELEEGRGWLRDAKDEKDKSLREIYPSRFEDMVEREAVRLGVQFQVGGKWTSFVAVVANSEEQLDAPVGSGPGNTDEAFHPELEALLRRTKRGGRSHRAGGSEERTATGAVAFGGLKGGGPAAPRYDYRPADCRYVPRPKGDDCSSRIVAPKEAGLGAVTRLKHHSADSADSGNRKQLASSAARKAASPVNISAKDMFLDEELEGEEDLAVDCLMAFDTDELARPAPKKQRNIAPPVPPGQQRSEISPAGAPQAMHEYIHPSPKTSQGPPAPVSPLPASESAYRLANELKPKPTSIREVVSALIASQNFDGSWSLPTLASILSNTDSTALHDAKSKMAAALDTSKLSGKVDDVFATALVVLFLQDKCAAEQDVWELVVDKAMAWLEVATEGSEKGLDAVWDVARRGVPSVDGLAL